MLAGRAEPAQRGLIARWSGRQRPAGVAPPDMKIHLEKNLEEERQILLQQQKLCRSRARRYFVESSRRKKAFEEKRKEQEEREYQIREQILQQRKQKFEEVTEKFQRAHIPLCQRRRAVFQRSVPPLEEALKQIQDSSLNSEVNHPSSHQPTIYWRAVDKALPSSLLKDDHTRQMPRLPDFSSGKETKENSRGGGAIKKHVFQLKLEEAQKLLEDQHLSSLQKFCHEVNQITNSETLSSVDSLEAGAPEEPYFLLDKEPSASAPQSSGSAAAADLQPAELRCSQDKLSFSTAQRISNWLINLDAPSVQDDVPFSDLSSQPTARPSEERVGSKGPPNPALLRAVERTAYPAGSPVCSSRAPGPDPRKSASETSTLRRAFRLERPLVTKSPALTLRKAWTPTDSPPREVAVLLEATQENSAPSLAPAAVPLGQPPRTQSARTWPKQSGHAEEINTGQCSFKLGECEDVDEEKKYSHCCRREAPLFSDVLQAAGAPHSPDPAAAQEGAGALSSAAISNYDLVGQHRKAKYSIHERSGMRFLKSILKKESKYEHDCFKALLLRQGFKLGSKKAAAIRDSIELTKAKGERIDIPKTVKRLRWFDETRSAEKDVDGSDPLRNRLDFTQACSQPFYAETVSEAATSAVRGPACTGGSAERQTPRDESVSENVPRVGGFGADQVPLKGFIPLGYGFAKESWLGPEEEGCQSPAQKAGPGSQKRGAAKVTRRARSAKAQSGDAHTSSKGIVVRAQSASKAKPFPQAQSQLSVLRPPPRPPSNVRSGKTSLVSPCPSIVPEGPQSTAARDGVQSKHLLPAEQELSQWSQRSGLAFSNICSELAAGLPSPPRCSNCQTLTTRNHLSGTQKAAQGDETFCHTHRCPDYEENQTAHTWRRQQNSLGHNEKTAESTATRRKRITENKRGILSEQKRQNPGAAAQRFRGQHVGQTIQLSSSESKQTATGTPVEQVSESTSEFLMAEDLVKASVAEEELLSALQSGQEGKPAPSSKETRQFNLCTLSAEEQEILWSLEHLNERLHYLQEIIYKNPSIKNTFKIIPALGSRPQASVSPDGGSRPRREY